MAMPDGGAACGVLPRARDRPCLAGAGSAWTARSQSRSSLLWVFHHFVLRSLAWNLSALHPPETACWKSFFSSLLELRKLETKPYCSASSALDSFGVAAPPEYVVE